MRNQKWPKNIREYADDISVGAAHLYFNPMPSIMHKQGRSHACFTVISDMSSYFFKCFFVCHSAIVLCCAHSPFSHSSMRWIIYNIFIYSFCRKKNCWESNFFSSERKKGEGGTSESEIEIVKILKRVVVVFFLILTSNRGLTDSFVLFQVEIYEWTSPKLHSYWKIYDNRHRYVGFSFFFLIHLVSRTRRDEKKNSEFLLLPTAMR